MSKIPEGMGEAGTGAPGTHYSSFSLQRRKGAVAGGGCEPGVCYASATVISAHLFTGRENNELSDVRTGERSPEQGQAVCEGQDCFWTGG